MDTPLETKGRQEVVTQLRFVLNRREQEYKDKMENAELYEGMLSTQFQIRLARYEEMAALNKEFNAILDAAEKRIQAEREGANL